MVLWQVVEEEVDSRGFDCLTMGACSMPMNTDLPNDEYILILFFAANKFLGSVIECSWFFEFPCSVLFVSEHLSTTLFTDSFHI